MFLVSYPFASLAFPRSLGVRYDLSMNYRCFWSLILLHRLLFQDPSACATIYPWTTGVFGLLSFCIADGTPKNFDQSSSVESHSRELSKNFKGHYRFFFDIIDDPTTSPQHWEIWEFIDVTSISSSKNSICYSQSNSWEINPERLQFFMQDTERRLNF